MIYKYRPEARVSGVKAEVAGPALMALREQHGTITPRIVVDEARSPGHPLHPAFEWDDSAAADEWRKAQARNLIKAIVVVQDEHPDAPPMRLFVNVTSEDEGQFYETVAAAYADDAMRQRVLDRALKDLEAWQHRYEELTELAEVFDAATRVRRKKRYAA